MKTDETLEATLLAYVSRPNYQPVKPRVIAKKLNLDDEQTAELKRVLKRLVKRGQLAYGVKHLVHAVNHPAATKTPRAPQSSAEAAPVAASAQEQAPPAATSEKSNTKQKPKAKKEKATGGVTSDSNNRITGVFRRTQAGHGFVRPSGAAPGHDRSQDYFVAPEDSADASTGDVVLLRPSKSAPSGRMRNPRAVVVEIIERETHQFVGTYFEQDGAAFVRVDGTLFSSPIAVGDPGAKNAQADDKVVFEMVRFPSSSHDGEGVITEVLGPRGTPGVDTLSIIREFDLIEEFAPDALEAARKAAEAFDESIDQDRLDLTGETVITIDPVDARDFDDAISLKRLENGHWMLGVHIADVSHFVQPGSALDREAHHRGTSVYLPDRVIPMLPEIISNGLASLQPQRVRYTKTAYIEFTADGAAVHTEVHNAAIKSQHRFAYEEIDEYLEDAQPWKEKLTPEVFSLVGRMHELAMILRQRRIKAGALELTMPEVKIDLDKDGRVSGAHRVINTVSHQIIEEFMLAANIAVAELLHRKEILFLRRVHMAPDPRKLKALTEFVATLGIPTDSLESRFEVQRLLHDVAGRPEQQAVNYAVLRSLQRAVYSPEEEGHFALASDCYCHFTSPIRRYPDLTIHRLIDMLVAQRKPRNDFGELAALGQHCSDRERAAEAAERELTKIKLLSYLAERIGEEMDAVVTGVEEFGLFVQGVELPAEGLVHISALQDDFYRYEKRTHSLNGNRAGNQFRLGDPIRVVVARVDVDRRELDFRLVQRGPAKPRVEKPRAEKPKSDRPKAARPKKKSRKR